MDAVPSVAFYVLMMHVVPNQNLYLTKRKLFVCATKCAHEFSDYSNGQLSAINYHCQTRNWLIGLEEPTATAPCSRLINCLRHILKGIKWSNLFFWLLFLPNFAAGFTRYTLSRHPNNRTFYIKTMGINPPPHFCKGCPPDFGPWLQTFSPNCQKSICEVSHWCWTKSSAWSSDSSQSSWMW